MVIHADRARLLLMPTPQHKRTTPRRGRRRARKHGAAVAVFGVVGELAITAGVVLLLFVAYTLWGTGLQTAQAQDDLREQFENRTTPTVESTQSQDPESTASEPAEIPVGEAYGVIEIPRFGDDWSWFIVQGTQDDDLKNGPGHYLDSAYPGELGNFAIAGHRSGHGEPFAQFPELQVGDEVTIRTANGTYVYELDSAPGGDPDGNRINISEVWVVDPVPGEPGAEPTERRITLTTCWPRYGSSHRMYATGTLIEGPDD